MCACWWSCITHEFGCLALMTRFASFYVYVLRPGCSIGLAGAGKAADNKKSAGGGDRRMQDAGQAFVTVALKEATCTSIVRVALTELQLRSLPCASSTLLVVILGPRCTVPAKLEPSAPFLAAQTTHTVALTMEQCDWRLHWGCHYIPDTENLPVLNCPKVPEAGRHWISDSISLCNVPDVRTQHYSTVHSIVVDPTRPMRHATASEQKGRTKQLGYKTGATANQYWQRVFATTTQCKRCTEQR